MKSLSVDGAWRLHPGEGVAAGRHEEGVGGPDSWLARVPGDMHLDLLRAGEIGEPVLGTNARELRWIEDKGW